MTTTTDDATRSDTEPTIADPATEPTTPVGATDDATTKTDESDTGDAAKWRSMARKHEAEAKKNAKALAELQKASLTDQERAVSEAEAKGRSTAMAEVGQRLAAAELRAAGVPADVIEDLNLSKFIDEAGELDTDAVTATASKFAVKPKAPQVPTGPRGGGTPEKPKTLGDAIAARINKKN